MKGIEFIIKKKVLIGLLTVLIVALGCFAVIKLDKELMPSVGMDGAYVSVDAGDMAAIDVERFITTPLEQKLQAIDGVEEVKSTTTIGSSTVDVIVARGRGEELFKEIERAANSIQTQHPAIREVVSGQYGVRQGYEFYMDISGGDIEEMTTFAKEVLEPGLEALKEVRDVHLSGVLEQEVTVKLKRDELVKNGLDSTQVMGFIAQANSETTIGELHNGQATSILRWTTKLEDLQSVKQIEIPTASGSVPLEEIATVSLAPMESSAFVWKNGTKDLVFVQVGRANRVNQIDMANAVRAEIQQMRDEGLIDGFTLNEMVAQADFVEESINGVTGNILIGSIVAIAILLLFLRNVRATLIIGVAIPTSVLLTFLTVYGLGYSLNLLTLIGLGLGIGMMVDSSIVILESIYRQRELGLNPLDAALVGTKEVAGAVIASMLTTIVVFLPIGFIGGDLGQFMIILSIVVAITLMSSVVIGFTLIPALSEKFLRYRKTVDTKKKGKVVSRYSAMIAWIVQKRRRSASVIVLFIALFVGSLFLVNKIPMSVMPDMFNRYSEVVVELEQGVDAHEKEQLSILMNDKLARIKDVESNYVLDSGSYLVAIINMTKGNAIQQEQKVVNEEIMRSLRELQQTKPIKSVQSMTDGASGSPVQVLIKGEDFDELRSLSKEFANKLKTVDGVVGVTNSMERTAEQKQIVVNQQAMDEAGLTQASVKHFVEETFMNRPVGDVVIQGKTVPLTVSWAAITDTEETLLNAMIPTHNGDNALSTFIQLETVQTPNVITHDAGERYVVVSADMEGRDLGAINRDVQKIIDEFTVPTGYAIDVAGDIEQQQQLLLEMIFVLAIALFLVYFVMAVQFNHLGHPILVMSVIPMAIIGVIVGLYITQMELNLLSGMGIIMLIGIVLNNAILLIDRTNQLRNEGMRLEEALVEAGRHRIRPIFMTTLTTVGGMLPLALASGVSGNYQAPLATVLISGLLFATLITLLLIPAVYRLFSKSDKVRESLKARRRVAIRKPKLEMSGSK